MPERPDFVLSGINHGHNMGEDVLYSGTVAAAMEGVTLGIPAMALSFAGGELKAEMTANAEIILEEHKNVLQIPEGAILYDKDKKASVEIPNPKAKEGKEKLAVNIGISNGAKTELLSGLKEGQEVVLQ